MISAQTVRQAVESDPELSQKYFIVDVKVSKDNDIVVKADTDAGITIDECGELSAAIEASLDRDAEDYDLEVSSPGLSEPLRLPRQYQKSIGKEVDIEMPDGERLHGRIAEAGEDAFAVETERTERQGGKKVKVSERNTYRYCDVKYVKLKITFK